MVASTNFMQCVQRGFSLYKGGAIDRDKALNIVRKCERQGEERVSAFSRCMFKQLKHIPKDPRSKLVEIGTRRFKLEADYDELTVAALTDNFKAHGSDKHNKEQSGRDLDYLRAYFQCGGFKDGEVPESNKKMFQEGKPVFK